MDAPIKILVVDDVAQNLTAIEALLARPNLNLLKAGSGAEALEMLLVEEVALALIDVRMPNMDGFELAELIRGASRTRDIPIIFMTAASRDPMRTFRGYEAGAVDFLHKPLDPQILTSKVDVFVELYSQRRRLSEQLDELRESLRLNEMFAAVLGHDLRNPLNAVAMGAELLLRQSSDESVVTSARRIQSSARRMARMIEQLLDVARIRARSLLLQMKPASIYDVCCTIRDELEAGAPARIALEVKGDTSATFDSDRLHQVFSNLLGNALQHGKAATEVLVDIDGTGNDAVTVRVGNQGGIPAERIKDLFEPFGPGRAPSHEGLGLGLYIANQLVQAHGGTLRASLQDATQTVFEVCIPRSPAPAGGAWRLDSASAAPER